MAKDYGNKRTTRQSRGAPHQLLVIVVTFLVGYLTAVFFDVQTISNWLNTQVLASHGQQQQAAKPAPQQAQVPPKPKFEFYTLLANEKGATQPTANSYPQVATKAPAPAAATSPSANGSAAVAATSAAKTTVRPGTNAPQIAAVKVSDAKAVAPPAQQQVNKGNFMVQVAAFKVRQDAEHMKGLLILKGFNVNVVPVTNAQGNWFRVVVGPYSNKTLAQQAQITLAKNERLRGMVTGG